MDECEWTSCEAMARLDVLAGPAAVRVVGAFCVPHASLVSSDVQERAGEPTWYDWHRPQTPARASGALPRGYRTAAVVPLVS